MAPSVVQVISCRYYDFSEMLPRVPTRALRQVTTLVSCMVAIVSVGSCDKVALLAPTESVVTLVSNRAVLPINGTAQIIATVIE